MIIRLKFGLLLVFCKKKDMEVSLSTKFSKDMDYKYYLFHISCQSTVMTRNKSKHPKLIQS